MEKPMIRELTTQEKFKDIRMLAHNLQITNPMHKWTKQSKYIYNRLEKIISICDEQIETTNKIVDDHAKEGERNA
jgi:alpha-galactosidase/6-phospho-beta-glucosidase family protein